MGWTRIVAVLAVGLALTWACKRRASGDSRANRAQAAALASSFQGEMPVFRDGDLIFHESLSGQSEMVRALSGSRFTHMGVVFNEPGGPRVLEAASPVRKTPVRKWIARGRDQDFVVKRLRDAETRLRPDVVTRMRALGSSWLGRPYDLKFRWDDQALYCSELAYKLFDRAAGVQLGKLQTAAEMNLDDQRVQSAMRKRFKAGTFKPDEVVVTPDAIFNAQQLVEIEP